MMNRAIALRFRIVFLLALFPLAASAALDQPWQKLSDPTAAEAARIFASPPPEYGAQFTWGWHGHVDRESIVRDLDGMLTCGVHAAIIEPGVGMLHPYLSPEYFDLVKVAVEEAKKRNMRLWIMDEGDYPSGLAGGKFTNEQPDLRMQVLAAPERVPVAAGATFTRELSPDVVCAVAVNKADQSNQVLDTTSGKVSWTAPAGDWEVVLARRIYRTMPTRSANNTVNVKDTTHSLMDYLDPKATGFFREWTFEGYRKAIGEEFGKTVLGFRGDEPGYGFNPWTPKLFDEFSRRKGYDLRPYVASFAGARNAALTVEQRRAYADYCDVWSDLFRDSYFNMEGNWCEQHGVEMQLHIEHEEILPQLAVADGDYFKCFRNIQVPGIDIIWHQIWMDNPADFPKLASSAAHLYGHPRAMCEAFAAYRPAPDVKQARWLLDFLLSRGINRIEYMFWPASTTRPGRAGGEGSPAPVGTPASPPASTPPAVAADGTVQPPRGSGGPRYYRDSAFPAAAAAVNRLSYLLGEGRPAAEIGLYLPSSSFWVGDQQAGQEINQSLLAIAHQLIEHQHDFDFIDEQALSFVLRPEGDRLVNLSGQGYRAMIVPPALAISEAALERLRAFAAAGGHVIFIGGAPALAVGKNFLTAKGPADIGWATLHESTVAVTPAVIEKLPAPDLALESANTLVSYTHRRLHDADIYFIFNSGDAKASLNAVLAGAGAAQVWSAETGKLAALPGAETREGRVRVPLELEPWTSKLIVIGNNPAPAANE